MKNFNKRLILLVGLLIGFISCEDRLELADLSAIGPDIVFSSDENVKLALLDAYDGLSAAALFGGNTLRNSELLASGGELAWSGTFNDPLDIFNKQITTINGDVANTWIAAYDAINAANNVLASLSVVNEDDREQVEGEALFIRGLAHFELVRLYALPYSAGNTSTNLGVPIMLAEDRNSVEQVSRATVEDVYQAVLSDLTTAEDQLSEGTSNNKATKAAAAAILSRVYLQMADYANARDAANRVIATGDYSLNPTYSSSFNGGTTAEDVFDIPVSNNDGTNSLHTFYASTALLGRGDIEVLTPHLDLYEVGDARLALFYADPVNGKMRTGKWVSQFGYVKVVRLAEMYLTRAECNLRLGTNIGDTPLNDINEIRDRSTLDDLGALTLADVLIERRRELAQEGHRIHDIKRIQGSVSEGADVYDFNNNNLVFPIPQRERNVNPNLEQNAGYF